MGITEINARDCPSGGSYGHNKYFFQVARRPLHYIPLSGCSARMSDTYNHHALFYDDEIFEFGPEGFQRRKNYHCGDVTEYTLYMDIKGYSTLSPNELERKIRDNGRFLYPSDYKVQGNNCQDFIIFCLTILDINIAEEYMKKL